MMVVGGSAFLTGVVVLATCGRRHPAWPLFLAIAALTFGAAQ